MELPVLMVLVNRPCFNYYPYDEPKQGKILYKFEGKELEERNCGFQKSPMQHLMQMFMIT